MARLHPTASLAALLALACGQPVTPAASPAQASAGAADPAASARLEDLRAQIVAVPAGQASFDLWVPDAVTMDGAAIGQDVAMAALLDPLLARGLFPRGFTAGAGGHTYHYRQGPPEVPGVPAPGAPWVIPRDIQAGRAYDVHAEHREGDSPVLAVDARVTVASVAAHAWTVH